VSNEESVLEYFGENINDTIRDVLKIFELSIKLPFV
jgi:hypothetical protein